jgi:hypothetical protein
MLPDFVLIVLVAAVLVLLAIGLCRVSGKADADMEACMAQQEAGEAGARRSDSPVEVQRGLVPQPAREAIQRGLDVGKRIGLAGGAGPRNPWIGRDQETAARRGRVKTRQRRRWRRIRVKVAGRVELISDGKVLDARPTMMEALTRAKEILADRPTGVDVIYFYDLRTGGYRGWLRVEDVA